MKQINTAILGYGFSGSIFFAPFLDLHPGFQLKGAWERSKKKIQADYPYVRSYTSLEEILADDTVDLVVVNTPIDTHYSYAKRVLEAGKHAIVEKTFTNTAAEARELYLLAKEKGLHLFVYQNRRFDSDFRTVKKVLERGKLGAIVEATLSYDLHHPQLRGDVHTEQPASGGEFNNRGSHVTDQAIVLFGLPEAVFADFAAFRPHSPVEDYFEVTLYYQDKRVKVRGTDISVAQQPAYILHGLDGSFLKSRSDLQEFRLLKGEKAKATHWSDEPAGEEGKLSYYKAGQPQTETVATEEGNYYHYFEAVYQTIMNGAPSPVTGLDGYRTMLVMDAARESAQKGAIVPIREQAV